MTITCLAFAVAIVKFGFIYFICVKGCETRRKKSEDTLVEMAMNEYDVSLGIDDVSPKKDS